MLGSYASVVDFISPGLSRNYLFTIYLVLFSKKIFHPGRIVVCPGLGVN
jgi:hypothetical protein